MSDPTSRPGEPSAEPRDVDDVVGSANEGLADADAAGRDAVSEPASPEPASPEAVEPGSAWSEPAAEPAAEPVSEPDVVPEPVPDTSVPASEELPAEGAVTPDDTVTTDDAAATTAYEAPTTAYGDYAPASDAPVVTASEPVGNAAPAGPAPIFVQAPEPPRPRGNRAPAGAIGLIAAVAFAVLYLAVWLVVGAVQGDVTLDNLGTVVLDALKTWSLWVPVVVFFIAFWLLGAIVNRGRWGVWVIVGLLVGVAAWGGHLLGQLFQAPFWELTASEGVDLVESQLWTPLAIAAFVIGRELTIWFGAWAAARGRRVAELNDEAQYEYERTIEAGPQLHRP